VLRLHSLETAVLAATDAAGRALTLALADGILSISLAEPLPVGPETAVTVRYRSTPTAGLFFHAPTKASPSTPLEMYSQGEGRENRRWFPCYDESDDRTTCEVYVTVPPGLRSVGNGVLVERKALDGGRTTDHWRLDHHPSYSSPLSAPLITDTWRVSSTTGRPAAPRFKGGGGTLR
jgi:aminopeptidase N